MAAVEHACKHRRRGTRRFGTQHSGLSSCPHVSALPPAAGSADRWPSNCTGLAARRRCRRPGRAGSWPGPSRRKPRTSGRSAPRSRPSGTSPVPPVARPGLPVEFTYSCLPSVTTVCAPFRATTHPRRSARAFAAALRDSGSCVNSTFRPNASSRRFASPGCGVMTRGPATFGTDPSHARFDSPAASSTSGFSISATAVFTSCAQAGVAPMPGPMASTSCSAACSRSCLRAESAKSPWSVSSASARSRTSPGPLRSVGRWRG